MPQVTYRCPSITVLGLPTLEPVLYRRGPSAEPVRTPTRESPHTVTRAQFSTPQRLSVQPRQRRRASKLRHAQYSSLTLLQTIL